MKKGMATYSSILAWRIPWTEEPGGLQSMGLQSLLNYQDEWEEATSQANLSLGTSLITSPNLEPKDLTTRGHCGSSFCLGRLFRNPQTQEGHCGGQWDQPVDTLVPLL